MGKGLVLLGIVLVIIGILVMYKIRIPFLGKLPGDIFVQGEHVQFYFPIMTSIILSIVLSVVLYLFSKMSH